MFPKRFERAWRTEHYADLAAVIFALQGIFAVLHRVLGGEYKGFSHGYNVVIDLGLAVLWFGGTIACLRRRSNLAWTVATLASLASLIQGVMFSVSSARGYGLPFMLAFFVTALCLARSLPLWRVETVSAERYHLWMRIRPPRHA
jgi:hypothetical protein